MTMMVTMPSRGITIEKSRSMCEHFENKNLSSEIIARRCLWRGEELTIHPDDDNWGDTNRRYNWYKGELYRDERMYVVSLDYGWFRSEEANIVNISVCRNTPTLPLIEFREVFFSNKDWEFWCEQIESYTPLTSLDGGMFRSYITVEPHPTITNDRLYWLDFVGWICGLALNSCFWGNFLPDAGKEHNADCQTLGPMKKFKTQYGIGLSRVLETPDPFIDIVNEILPKPLNEAQA